jgi:hypothetical protein
MDLREIVLILEDSFGTGALGHWLRPGRRKRNYRVPNVDRAACASST